MFPLNTRQFSSTFLDIGRNSRGYAHEVRSADRDATKRLLSPVLLKDNNSTSSSSCRCIPLRHALGNTMWDFARRSTTLQCHSRNQNTGLNSHVYHWNSQEDGEGNIDDDEDDDDYDEDDDATSFPGSSSKRSTLGMRLDVDDDIDDDDDKDDDVTSFPGSSSKRSTLGTRLDVDDDIDDDYDGDDDNFQFTPSLTDDPSHNSELSAVCFTSNAPTCTCTCVPLVCKTEDLSKKPYSEHTKALQGNITVSTKVNEAANVTDSFNDTTAIGRDNCSNLQNGDSHFIEARVNCEVGTAKVHPCNDNARSSLTFNDDDDNVYYGSDNSSNGASRNVKLQHVVEQANVSKEAKLGSNRCVLSEQEITQESMDNDFYLVDGQCQNEKNLHSEESVTCAPYTYSDIKEADVSNSYYQSDSSVCAKMDDSDELLHNEPRVKPLPLYKQGVCKTKTISPSLTLNLKLEVLKSVLHTETKFSRNDENVPVDICGKIAILSGFQEDGRSCISVLESEVVGQYDYIAGLVHVHPLGQHGYQHQADDVVYENIKDPLPPGANMSVDLSTFLEQSCCIPQAPLPHTAKTGTVLKEHSPVAWLLTSPALGVTLDWQVQEKLLTCVQQMTYDKSCDEQHESETSQWYNVLVVVDEYRCVEKDTPLIEVYELCGNGLVNLVNFELN